MKIKRVCGVYFSATGTTEKIVFNLGKYLSEKLEVDFSIFDFTPLDSRKKNLEFQKEDLVILGVPTIAGRVPNLLLKYLQSISGNGALAVAIVLYGNRNYDDSLIELRDILSEDNFNVIAGGAFIGEHSFSNILGKGRPDNKDMVILENFSSKIVKKIENQDFTFVDVKGVKKPYRWYYQPKDENGNPIDIRKVKPLTNDRCINCKLCVKLCPMGSINFENVKEVSAICIKCCACIKKCPTDAKYFDDLGYIYHKNKLEEDFTRRAEPEIFL